MTAQLLNYRYRILKSLGEGGFGKTFLAEDTQMPSRRSCVIKQLKPMSDRPEVFQLVKERFAREAAVLEAVGKGHSQIPDLYAYFEAGGQFYLVQEWIEGKPLSAVANDAWTEANVSQFLASALDALAHVHGQNIIHRDIKPDNIILRQADRLPCLIDFGAVKELMSTVMGSQAKSLAIGTPGFMPPEQAAGRPTFASDLYSLGMTAIYLLTERSPAELPADSRSGQVQWQQHAPQTSDRLANILARAIHPYSQNRYATAADMLSALIPMVPETHALVQTIPASTQAPPQPAAPARSGVPTVVVAPQAANRPNKSSIQPSTANTQTASTQTVAVPAARTIKGLGAAKRPWQRLGLVAGGLLLGAGAIAGLRPQLSPSTGQIASQPESFQAAVASLEAEVAANPDRDEAQLSLADAYRQVGSYEAAIAQLKPLLTKDPVKAAALVAQGKVQIETGDYSGAIATLTAALERDGTSAEAYNLRGDAYTETGEYDGALDDYRSALRADPKNAEAYANWAAVNVVQGNLQEALQNLDLAVKNDPNSISAYVNRGSRKAELGDRVGAGEDWQRAIALTPNTAREYASRGYAKSRTGDKQGAIDDYNQALIINPNLARAYTNRAAIFYEQGEKEQALEELGKALATNPNSVTALILKGEILAFQTNPDWQGALAAYTQALAVNSKDPDVLNNRCGAYFALEQLDLAIADCTKGLETNPRSAALYVERGNIRLRQANYDGAIQDYSRAIEIGDENGGDPRRQNAAYSNRASARAQLQDFDGAIADLDKALELNPDAAEDYYKRGLIKGTLGDKPAAKTDLQKAADLYVEQGRTDSHQNVLAVMQQLGI